MFINEIKEFVSTLVSILIFISAVELIVPNNKIKKYVKFILGLILLTTILNPIIKFVTNGQDTITQDIKQYEEVFSKNNNQINIDYDSAKDKNVKSTKDSRETAFIENFNKNCESLLKSQYKNMDFKSDIDCTVDFEKMSFEINKLKIGVYDKKISKVKKIVIKENANDKTENNKEYEDQINFLANELNISKDKIEVYKLEE